MTADEPPPSDHASNHSAKPAERTGIDASDLTERVGLVGEYVAAVQTLLSRLPAVHAALGGKSETLDTVPGWQAASQRLHAITAQGSTPSLVATLYGTSGAGKSTLFRLVTGVPVPVGWKRPTSRSCFAAVPRSLGEPALRKVFPDYRLERLDDVSQLQEPSVEERLYYDGYEPPSEDGRLRLVLVDVPDFNAVERSNWAKAERMMRRAEVVVFAVSVESYKDDVAVRELARCCRIAGTMVFLLSKVRSSGGEGTARQIAHEILEDLRETAESHPDFQELRQDGRSLHEFLRDSVSYFTPYDEALTLEGVRPIDADGPPFTSHLFGLDAEAALVSSVIEPASQLATEAKRMLARAGQEMETLEQSLSSIDADIRIAAEIASVQFPVGRMVELVYEEAAGWKIPGLSMLTAPFEIVNKLAKELHGLVFGGRQERIKDRDELERERFVAECERLIGKWRNEQFREEVSRSGILADDRVDRIERGLLQTDVPRPKTDWEEAVRTGLQTWSRENPKKAFWLVNSPYFLAIASATGVLADLVLTGGVVGTIGGLAVAGAGGIVTAGRMAKWLEEAHLLDIAKQAESDWKNQRAGELQAHLQSGYADPLFEPWRKRLNALRSLTADEIRTACGDLDRLAKRIGKL